MKNYNIHHFNQIDSTNAYALNNIDSLKDHDIIQADIQTNGYGRFKRHWISSASSNIYISIILKPKHYQNSLANLTQYMSLVICKIFEKYSVQPTLKWPNDVFVNGAKISGLLSETSFHGSEFKGYVLGVGINLNMTPDELDDIDQEATSLNLLCNHFVDREVFLKELLDLFFEDYESVLQNGFKVIASNYIKCSPYLGNRIKINTLDNVYEGVASGFDNEGCLILRLDSGEDKVFNVGDVLF